MVLLAIHTGGGDRENGGTLLTPEILAWVMAKLDNDKHFAGLAAGNQQGRNYSGGSSHKPTTTSVGDIRKQDLASFNVNKRFMEDGTLTFAEVICVTTDGRSVTMSVEDFRALTDGDYDDNLANFGVI